MLIGVALGVMLFGVLTSTARFWQLDGSILLPSGTYTLLPAAIAGLLAFKLANSDNRVSQALLGCSLALVLVFISDWPARYYNFFPDPALRGEIALGGMIFGLVPFKTRGVVIRIFVSIALVGLLGIFLWEAHGRLLNSDDHASFLFRLNLLKEKFPTIPFYYPDWNGGLDARDFFATGSLAEFILFAPVVYLTDLNQTYTLLIALTLFVLFPACLFAATRLLSEQRNAPWLAALLGVCSSIVWYRWTLKFGTVGFTVAAILLPLTMALSVRQLDFERSRKETAAFIIVSTLTVLWTGSALALIPTAIIVALRVVSWLLRRELAAHRRFLFATILLVCINAPWMWLFWNISRVGSFLSRDVAPSHTQALEAHTQALEAESAPLPQSGEHKGFRNRAGSLNLATFKKALSQIREKSLATNPLIVFLGFPALFLLPRSRVVLFGATGLWLLLLGSVGVPLKPQLELDRMLVVLGIVFSIPTAIGVAELSSKPRPNWIHSLAFGLVAGFTFASPLCTAAVISNRTVEQFAFASNLFTNLADAIKTLGGDGRIVFSGCIVHELDEGHVAPLSLVSGKPLIASAPFHTLWRYTQVVPKSFIARGDDGIRDYFDLVNASSVIAHEKNWREYFDQRPESYQRVWQQGRFFLYRRLQWPNSYVYQGAGALLSQSIDRVVVRPDSARVVLRFNYFPFLTASGCSIAPYNAAPEVQLIELSGCVSGVPVTIISKNPLERAIS